MKIYPEHLKIDWGWVKKELMRKERIDLSIKNPSGAAIEIAINRCLKKAKTLTDPSAIMEMKTITDIKKESIELDGDINFSGRRVSGYIKGAGYAYLFLVTIGKRLENEASRLMSKGEALDGYLLDSIGSLAVESLAERIEEDLKKEYRPKGKSVSMRLSPGYCDWPIEEQSVMKKVLGFSKIGVSLTRNCMMVPKKSISAMIAVGPKGLFSEKEAQCSVCDKTDCDYRRIF